MDEAILERRFLAAAQLYNSVLQMGKKTIDEIRRHPSYLKAVQIPRSNAALRDTRKELFGEAHREIEFNLSRFERAAGHTASFEETKRKNKKQAEKAATPDSTPRASRGAQSVRVSRTEIEDSTHPRAPRSTDRNKSVAGKSVA